MRRIVFAVVLFVAGCSASDSTGPMIGLDPNLDPILVRPGRWANVGKACSDRAMAESVPASRLVGYSNGSDDQWAWLARTVPGGFGGLLINRGAMTMYLVDPAEFDAAASAVAAAGYQRPTAVLHGRWNFAQMFDWAGVIWSSMPPMRALTSFDIDEGMNRLDFGVADSASLETLDKVFSTMNLPCRLVWLSVQPPVVPL